MNEYVFFGMILIINPMGLSHLDYLFIILSFSGYILCFCRDIDHTSLIINLFFPRNPSLSQRRKGEEKSVNPGRVLQRTLHFLGLDDPQEAQSRFLL